MKTKSLLTITGITALIAGITACTTDSVVEPPPIAAVQADTATNIFAFKPATAPITVSNLDANLTPFAIKTASNVRADSVAPAFTYYSLAAGAAVADSNASWDIAFNGTTIKVNGTSQLLTTNFEALALAPESGYAAGNAPTWYDYSGNPNHLITPKAGAVLVVKTIGNKYAKIEFRSYYKGAPATPNGLNDTAKYYTFRYAYQADGTRNLDAALIGAPRTYYSLSQGRITDSVSQWDVSMRGTSITVNGQVQLVAGSFDSLTTAPTAGYGSTIGVWYNYAGAPSHLITPKSDTVIVIKTQDGKYAKIEILSYYKNNPVTPNGLTDTARHYTFRYYLQADGSTNLRAGGNTAPKTYFSLRSGAEVADSTQQWDIAFRATSITVNGGAKLLTGVNFDGLGEVSENDFSAGSVPTWYDYNLDGNHTITPKLGTVIALKTADNKYAKLQILSYYQNAPATPSGTQHTARYYTFRYVLQPNGSRIFP
jgi:hypothetical protein